MRLFEVDVRGLLPAHDPRSVRLVQFMAAANDAITAGILYLIVTYGVLFAFRKIEHRLSGHLRARLDEREQIATEALAVR